MKITPRILSIPPYLSTTWKNISALHVRPVGDRFTLIVLLQSQAQVEVPNLDKGTVDAVFEAHAKSEEETSLLKNPLQGPLSFSLPIKDVEGGLADSLGTSLQHNPEQANLPPIPTEILNRISMITKAIGLEDTSALPKPQPNCNCMFCQVARTLHNEIEEEVSDEDLTFRSNWEIKQAGDKLYTVTNTLDGNEHYNVFLGSPLGCTCGSKNCDHIRAVLST